MMSHKKAKAIRKKNRKHERQMIIKVIQDIKSFPFIPRLSIAWSTLTGKNKKLIIATIFLILFLFFAIGYATAVTFPPENILFLLLAYK